MANFDKILKRIANDIWDEYQIECLGKALGLRTAEIKRAIMQNKGDQCITSSGTFDMLNKWNQGVRMSEKRALLRQALKEANLSTIADEHLSEAAG